MTCGPPKTTFAPVARMASAILYARAAMRVIALIPTSRMSFNRTNCAIAFSVIGWAFPSIKNTLCSGGVRLLSKNIQRCGMKLRVTPLSGLYSRMFIEFVPCAEGPVYRTGRTPRRHTGDAPRTYQSSIIRPL